MFYHRYTHTLAILFLLCISAVKSYAGFPDTIKVDSKSCAIYPTDSVTDPNKFYRITITGTYKMWPGQDGPNADAGYIFYIPKSIYGGTLWPNKELVSPKETMQMPLSFNNSRTYRKNRE